MFAFFFFETDEENIHVLLYVLFQNETLNKFQYLMTTKDEPYKKKNTDINEIKCVFFFFYIKRNYKKNRLLLNKTNKPTANKI